MLAEQYDGTTPPAGACTCTANPAWTDGLHVHAPTGMIAVTAGDWVVEDLWTHDLDVMPDAEFTARF